MAFMFLLICPFLGPVVYLLAAIITCLVKGDGYKPSSHKEHVDASIPEVSKSQEEGYVDKRTLAEKFDGRLTNIFKNPFDGIL